MTQPAVSPRIALLLDKDDDLEIESSWLDAELYRDWSVRTVSLASDDSACLDTAVSTVELSVQLCSASNMQTLNRDYRGKNSPTNVLSFPSGMSPLPEGDSESLLWPLGDLVLCPEIVIDEARDQGKPLANHRAHMIVHGVLHLLGHDHEEEAPAKAMEQLEIRILSKSMVPNPYSDPPSDE